MTNDITIYNLEQFTAQQVFDKVATHLLTQGKQAARYGACAYRTPAGLKCAIGCLIPDDKYIPEMEGLYSYFRVTTAHNHLLLKLQDIHDDYRGSAKWAENLKYLGEEFNLNTNAITNFEGNKI